MTRDDIIRMAREAGFETGTALCEVVVRHSNGSWVGINAEDLERFATLVAAAEREACAAICEYGWKTGVGEKYQGDVFATTIRSRGNQ